jgi:hypothetical protein
VRTSTGFTAIGSRGRGSRWRSTIWAHSSTLWDETLRYKIDAPWPNGRIRRAMRERIDAELGPLDLLAALAGSFDSLLESSESVCRNGRQSSTPTPT